jgi:MYXO-CTERM domain-containing protein
MIPQGLRISAIALALVAGTPALAQEATTEPVITEPVAVEQDDGFDWGWLGLLGLLGLAGLSGRKRDHDVHTTTTAPRKTL